MHHPSGSFDSSAFMRKLSLRKKKWPDDFIPKRKKSMPCSPQGGVRRTFFVHQHSLNGVEVLSSHVLSELRAQFSEQIKCLDTKLDLDVTVMSELHDFYRRRALVEQEYSDNLTKLVNSLRHKHSNETAKRPHWTSYTTTTLWGTVLASTLQLSDAHSTLSEVLSKHMSQRLIDMDEDANRLHKQCREMMMKCQEKVFANIAKLQSDQREYGQRQSTQLEADRIRKRSEEKLTAALNYIQTKKKDPEKSQRFRRAQTDYNQKRHVFENTVVASNRARNEYLIQLCAANQSINRYFTDEVSDIIDCMSCGLHNSLARAAMMHLSSEEAIKNFHARVGEAINRNITALDWRADKSAFLKQNEAAFSRPPAFVFLPFKDDMESEVSPVPPLRDSLAATAADLKANVDQLRLSTEETWNTLQEIEKKLLVLINQNDYDVSELFSNSALTRKRHRRRSTSPVNGDATSGAANTSNTPTTGGTRTMAPTSPSVHAHDSAHSSSSHNATSRENLSSGLPPDEMGSKISVGSNSTAEIQPGLYLSMRTTYRDQRIKQERIYMDSFSAYTQEIHRYNVMQAKLAEIERALAATVATTTTTASSSSTHPPQLPFSAHPLPMELVSHSSPGGSSLQFSAAEHHLMTTSAASANDQLGPPTTPPPAALVKMAPRRVLQVPNVGRPKLFGGSIDEYVTVTGEQIPRVVLSCIRVINLYGMHHQGIFRVPGSQAEINNFKTAFEYGEDPLVGLSDARDINSTAGLLKLYFRELGEPPFPKAVFMELINVVMERRDSDDCVERMASIVSIGLSRAVFVVMRYLFAFLHHLAEYSDENMMDPYNLAICFGPTLMPSPAELDQVECQTSVNDVVKLFISHHRRIFDPTVLGAYYEKFSASYATTAPPVLPLTIAREAVLKANSLRHQANSLMDSPRSLAGCEEKDGKHQQLLNESVERISLDTALDDEDSDSETEDLDINQGKAAVSLADFTGTSARELSFRRGADLVLYRRLNDHWWEGQPLGASSPTSDPRYLVPNLYVKVVRSSSPSCSDVNSTKPLERDPEHAMEEEGGGFQKATPETSSMSLPEKTSTSPSREDEKQPSLTDSASSQSSSSKNVASEVPGKPKRPNILDAAHDICQQDTKAVVQSTPNEDSRSASRSPQRRIAVVSSGGRGSWAGVPNPSFMTAVTTASVVTTPAGGDFTLPLETVPEYGPAPKSPEVEAPQLSESNLAPNNDSPVVEALSDLENSEPSANSQSTAEAVTQHSCPPENPSTDVASLPPDIPRRRLPATQCGTTSSLQTSSVTSPVDEEHRTEHFAEQAGGTVRKRVSAHLTLFQKQQNQGLPTSASATSDLSRAAASGPPKPALWTTTAVPPNREDDAGGTESNESKENSVEDAPAIKRGSIAARVAVFEASSGLGSSSPSGRPAWVRK